MIDVSDRTLAAGAFATHGLADLALTWSVFLVTGATLHESNPLLRRLMSYFYQSGIADSFVFRPAVDAWVASLALAAGVKLLCVLFAAGLLWYGRESIPRWRMFAASVSLLGILVVLSNLLVIL